MGIFKTTQLAPQRAGDRRKAKPASKPAKPRAPRERKPRMINVLDRNRDFRKTHNLEPSKTGRLMKNPAPGLMVSDQVRLVWSGTGSVFAYCQSGIGNLGLSGNAADLKGNRGSAAPTDEARGNSNPDGYWRVERLIDGRWVRWIAVGPDLPEALNKARILAQSITAAMVPVKSAYRPGDGIRRARSVSRKNRLKVGKAS